MAQIIMLNEGHKEAKEKYRKKLGRKRLILKIFVGVYIFQTLLTTYIVVKLVEEPTAFNYLKSLF